MMELLSPAGNMECLTAAVQNGADAVYFGGSMLNARRFADNFAGDKLRSAVDYCHERGVKAYITLNTLVFDRELFSALDFAEELYRCGTDAVLVQDLGLAALIRHRLPELTLHASTQMGIHDIGGLRYCESIGMKRAVLAREVSLEQIRSLAAASGIELEAFGHGALCMSFSGSCLYSSMSGERSGNRGPCAQPCRKQASVSGRPGPNDFCLSPNDICMIEYLDELEKAGICCIKLEGRMKKPEYVAAVTRCYRTALDGASKQEIKQLKDELFRFFNRGEFSTSHIFTDSVRTDRVGSSKPDKNDIAAAKQSYNGEFRKRAADMALSLNVGQNAVLKMTCGGHSVSEKGASVQQAEKPQSRENYIAKLSKLGDTPFELRNCTVDMTDDCYLSAAELNAMRRSACEQLAACFRVRNEKVIDAAPFIKFKSNERTAPITKAPFIYCVVQSAADAQLAFENGADAVAIEPNRILPDELKTLDTYRRNGKKLLLALPNVIITEVQRNYIKGLIESGCFDGAEANNIGQLDLIRDLPVRIAGIGLNALNSYTVQELLRVGFDYVIPSQELTEIQLQALMSEYGDRMILWVHGRVPLMQLLHCPVKEHLKCRNCAWDAGCVTDEAGRRFPLNTIRYPDKCLVRMLNCFPTDLIDTAQKLPKCAGLRLGFIGEAPSAIPERLQALRTAQSGGNVMQYPDSTKGHWNRKVD